MKIAVAGTFNALHVGHKTIIDRALSFGGEVFIGITSDDMARCSRGFVNPYHIRYKSVKDYVESKGKECFLFEINDVYGPSNIMRDVDILVVSEETFENGKKVIGRFSAIKKIELSVVKMVSKTDGSKISSTDVMNGVCSRSGNMEAMDIAVGSLNFVKIEAVREVMERIYGDVRIFAVSVDSGVPEQPFEEETERGAKNRAKACIGNHTLGVGIEAGVFDRYGFLYDIQHCAVVDKDGGITTGLGPGFRYPNEISELVKRGMTVSEAVERIYGKENVGQTCGAVGVLSKGVIDRKELTKQSVIAAMIPRLWGKIRNL
ncbi:MAG: inosine/xanthosine triphosphatase [archaeon]|nr:inosine/xanthosine triphosphatase [archaeon]